MEQKISRHARGPRKMSSGQYMITEIMDNGEPTVPVSARGPFKTAYEVMARDHVAITYRSWSGHESNRWVVLDDVNDILWSKMMEVF